MKIENTPLENHQMKVHVELDAEEFEPLKVKAAKAISRSNKLPGFRAGKAPYHIVKQQFGDLAIAQEALEIFLENSYEEILQKANIKPCAMGRLDVVDQINPPIFSIIVPLQAVVDLGDYRAIREDYPEIAVTDDEFSEELKALRTRFAVEEPVDGEIEEGQTVYVILKAKSDDGEEELIKEMSLECVIPAEENENEKPYVGYARSLIGAKAGEIVTSEYTYPEEESDKDLSGKKAIFTTVIQSNKILVLPEENLDFAKNFGDFDSYEAFLEYFRENLSLQKKGNLEKEYLNKVIEKIKNQAVIQFCQQELDEIVQQETENFKMRMADQGLDLMTYLKSRNTTLEEFVQNEIEPKSKNNFLEKLVIQEFGKLEKIKIDNDAMMRRIQEESYRFSAEEMKNKTKKQREDYFNRVYMSVMNNVYLEALFNRMLAIAKGENPEIEENADLLPEVPYVTDAVEIPSEEIIQAPVAETPSEEETETL